MVGQKILRHKRKPEVNDAHEFLEITKDFTDPKEAIREAISNSLDWKATEIQITISEDRRRPDNELIIEISDNGAGLDEERLQAFFDLGHPTGLQFDDLGNKVSGRIGEKGHGTKTFYNSRRIEVESDSVHCTVYAIMDLPMQKLLNNEVPEYDYDIELKENHETGTRLKIYGYNNNQKRDFGHSVLLDYILWYTKFGSIEREFGEGEFGDEYAKTLYLLSIFDNLGKALYLRGLGAQEKERIGYGHVFPEENCDIERLMLEHPGEGMKFYVKRWLFKGYPVRNNPGKTLDFLLYVEGDSAKHAYNPMLRSPRSRGTPAYGTYKVEDRYGLHACKDYIPIRLYNEWLGLGKREETKYHAFVNCQEYWLTANRGDVTNTPPDFLENIIATIQEIFYEQIRESSEYKEYEDAAELEEQYRDAKQEKSDFERRKRLALRKNACTFKGIELIEPRQETGVIALFNKITALEPGLFPFRVIDYDSKRGYDALVAEKTVRTLDRESIYFAEFKHTLVKDFNHSFSNLSAVICWDSSLSDGVEVTDIENNRRVLRITPPLGNQDYTKYMLVSQTSRHNLEVYVLKDFLKEKLGIEFRPRASS